MSVNHIDEKDRRSEIKRGMAGVASPDNLEDEEENDLVEEEFVTVDFEAIYNKPGEPQWNNPRTKRYRTLTEDNECVVYNDHYLKNLNPIGILGESITFLAKKAQNYEQISGYNLEQNSFEPYVEAHQQRHGHSEGGKGLSHFTKSILNHNMGMSNMTCLPVHSDTNLLTLKNGNTISIGKVLRENIVGLNIEIAEGEFSKIKKTFINPNADVYSYEDEEGTIYECTADHPFMTLIEGKEVEMAIDEIFTKGYKILKK